MGKNKPYNNSQHKRTTVALNKNKNRNKEGHYVIIKGSIHKRDKININIYAPYKKTYVTKSTKQKLTELRAIGKSK